MASERPSSRLTRRQPSSTVLDRQRSMVMRAAEEGLGNLVIFALDIDPQVDARRLAEPADPQHVPLVTACLKGHLEVAKNLVERCQASISDCRADVSVENQAVPGVTPLWAASYSGNLDLVKYLVGKGAGVNATTPTGSSPLRASVFEGHFPVVRFLVKHGANVNTKNNFNGTALMISCWKKFKDITSYLLQNGADTNLQDADDIAKLLLQHGATITRSKWDETPLLVAAYKKHEDLVNFLVDVPDFSRDEVADAVELLGAAKFRKDEVDDSLGLWERAMKLRHQPGKPVAWKREADRKVPAYNNASEIQTLQDLKVLQAARDTNKIWIQAMLIAERVLGKDNEETTDIIRYCAAEHADENNFRRATELSQHAIDNISTLFPFLYHTCRMYAFVLDIIVSGLAMSEKEDKPQDLSLPTFSQCLQVLKSAVTDFNRGEKDAQNDGSDDTTRRRQQLLKMIMQFICLLSYVKDCTTTAEWRETMEIVAAFVKTGVRGQGGNTLLHVACDEDTTRFDPDENGDYTAFDFPSQDVVEVLLEAGSDVSARNEAGKTALQVIQDQDGDQSAIIELLQTGMQDLRNNKDMNEHN